MAFLKVENIVKSFDNTLVLKSINFQVSKGEVVAIIGSSGSGKTTLLRCLNFLERPDDGKIFIEDNLIFDAKSQEENEKTIRRKRLHFGLVFQSFNLFPQYTVKKNIELASTLQSKAKIKELTQRRAPDLGAPPELSNINTDGASPIAYNTKQAKANKKAMIANFKKSEHDKIENIASTLLAKVGLSEKANNYPCELSGGQQQRVAIARALALSPDILCFDEPTSALDPELTGEVLKVIKGLKSSNATMIVVTHEMDFAKNVADKIIFMANGIIEEEGIPQEFFASPKSELAKQFLSRATQEI